ncbi:hypothetical protein PV797_09510 [Clostridiaceae bacterium M8S5]|nr:hypothetical protein PV797_09510 [Clostridiaceae bacterium M8S5]
MKSIENFILEKNIKIRGYSHEKCVRLITPFLYSYSGDSNNLPSLIEHIMNLDLDIKKIRTACFNGKFYEDKLVKPFKMDLYIHYNDYEIYVYYFSNIEDVNKLKEEYPLSKNEYRLIIYENNMKDIVTKFTSEKCIIFPSYKINQLIDSTHSIKRGII